MYIILVFSFCLCYLWLKFLEKGNGRRHWKYSNSCICKEYKSEDNCAKHKCKMMAVCGGFILFLYGALRSPLVGVDTFMYAEFFDQVKNLTFSQILNASDSYAYSRDPVFFCFLKVLSFLWMDSQIMLIALSAIVAVCTAVFIFRNSNSTESVFLSFIIFIALRYYSFTLTGLRQAVSLSLLMISYELIKKNRYIKFIILVIIASLFHKSALIFLIAYPLAKVRKIGFLSISAIIFTAANIVTNYRIMDLISQISIFSQYENYFIERENSSGITTMVIYVIILFLAYMNFKNILSTNANICLFFNMTVIGITFSSMMFSYPNIFRIGYYFIISIIIVLPACLESIRDRRMRMLTFLNATMSLIVQYIIIGPGAGTKDYFFFWK